MKKNSRRTYIYICICIYIYIYEELIHSIGVYFSIVFLGRRYRMKPTESKLELTRGDWSNSSRKCGYQSIPLCFKAPWHPSKGDHESVFLLVNI